MASDPCSHNLIACLFECCDWEGKEQWRRGRLKIINKCAQILRAINKLPATHVSPPSHLPHPTLPLFSSILYLVLCNLLQVPVIHKFCLEMGFQARPTRSSKSTSNTSPIVHGKKGVAEPFATPRKSQPTKRKKGAQGEDKNEEDNEDLDTPTKPVLF